MMTLRETELRRLKESFGSRTDNHRNGTRGGEPLRHCRSKFIFSSSYLSFISFSADALRGLYYNRSRTEAVRFPESQVPDFALTRLLATTHTLAASLTSELVEIGNTDVRCIRSSPWKGEEKTRDSLRVVSIIIRSTCQWVALAGVILCQ